MCCHCYAAANLITFSFVCLFPFPIFLVFVLCLCVLQYKSVFRSYSQDFVPHNQVSIPPFLSSTSSSCSTPPFPPVHPSQSPDLAVPAAASQSPSTVDVPNSSSQESSFNGNAPVCLPSETSFTDSLQTPSVRLSKEMITHLNARLPLFVGVFFKENVSCVNTC